MARNLGSIPLQEVQSDVFASCYFVRVDVASPIGTKRFTDYFGGAFTGNIDGGSQTWSDANFTLGTLNQSAQGTVNVSSMTFANLDALWTGWAISPGLRGAKVLIWIAYFNRSTGALYDSIKLFEGTIDSGEFGDAAQVAIAPYLKPWSRQVPAITGLMLGATPLMPDEQVTIRWADAVGSIVGFKPGRNTSGSAGGAPKPVDTGGFSWANNPFSGYIGTGRIPQR